MKFNGNLIRLMLLATLLAFLATYSAREVIRKDDGDLQVFLCETDAVMRECKGPNDYETCADLDVSCIASACGHQLAHHVDVSVSGADDALAADGTPTGVLAGFMIFWSVMPYALVVALLGAFLFLGDTTSLSFLFLMGTIGIVNEFVIKQLFNMHRPTGSCLYFKSYGMPSGHATTSIGIMWDFLLEIWVDRPGLSLERKFGLTILAVVALAPVPYSRVYLHDHFTLQVIVGSAVGVAVATLWFLFMYFFARSRLDAWAELLCCKCFRIRNSYRNSEELLPKWWTGNEPLFDEETAIVSNLSGTADGGGKSGYTELP